MAKEYSIYFDSKKIVLISDFKYHFINQAGLFVKCNNSDDLTKILDFFKTSRCSYLNIIGKDTKGTLKLFSKNFRLIEAAGGLVRNELNQILVINRNGKWDLPKGKVDDNEANEQTALREVREECGVKNLEIIGKLTKTYHTYKIGEIDVLKRTTWYEMNYIGNEKLVPQSEEGILAVEWFEPNELTKLFENTYESIKDVFRAAGLS
jgi:8-oxo-dGTP pyrophosphatase MutT (NUDIX family)